MFSKIIWTNRARIEESNLDGSNRKELAVGSSPVGVDVDENGDYVFIYFGKKT